MLFEQLLVFGLVALVVAHVDYSNCVFGLTCRILHVFALLGLEGDGFLIGKQHLLGLSVGSSKEEL